MLPSQLKIYAGLDSHHYVVLNYLIIFLPTEGLKMHSVLKFFVVRVAFVYLLGTVRYLSYETPAIGDPEVMSSV